MKLKNLLTEAETFTATNKKTGKTSVFKSKDSRDAAIAARTHTKIKDPNDSKKSTKGGVNIFDKKPASGNSGSTTGPNFQLKTKYDDNAYWKDVSGDKISYGGNWGDPNWGPQKTSNALSKIETALKDELQLEKNGFDTTRGSSGGGDGGWEEPMAIYDENADWDSDDFISLSVGSPNNDGKMSIVFANADGIPYFEPDYDALTGENDLKPQQAHKLTKELMKMPEVQKLLKGEMQIDEFQPIYDKLKAKFSKGKTESLKLTPMIKNINEAEETFTATNKASGKTSVFKSKNSRDAAVKAGTHTAIKDPKAGGKAKSGVNVFDKPVAGSKKGKDDKSKAPVMKHTKVGEDSLEVKTISNFTNLRAKALSDFINKNKLDATAIANFVKKGSLRDRMDIGTAIVGNPGNKYEKKVIKQFGAKEEQPKVEPKAKTAPANLGVDKVVYNTRTKTVGIVRMADERGETKTDADGNVNTSELEPYNPTKYPHQKDAKVAPSTQKEVDARGLWNPFAQDEPKEEPKQTEPAKKRPGNPTVNKEAKKSAESFGITPEKLGNDGYKKVMLQSAVEALTDANFHDEARELISKIEGKPEWAKRVNYPSMDDPKYKEKMADIRTNGVDSSEYWRGDDNAHEFGRKVSSASGWDGVDAADGIAFTLRMNGFHKQADMIQSVFDNKPYMRNESTSLKSLLPKK